MDSTDEILKRVTESIYEEENIFFITLDTYGLNLPLKGRQRLVMGGDATPALEISNNGIAASLSIDKVHYDVIIPWGSVSAVEGRKKAFYCRRETGGKKSCPHDNKKKKSSHLRVIK